mgnify:CR=1 FL=1
MLVARELTVTEIILRVLISVAIGGLIGLERGMKNRPAGLRTYMLVCVGACLIMVTNQFIFQTYGVGDPVRMGAQVISGIGFLGAGTIIVTRRNQIKGLTTAAGLWASAGVGLALGIGFYEAAFVGALAVFGVMTLLQRMDNRMHRMSRVAEVYVELSPELALGNFLRILREQSIEVVEIIRELDSESAPDNRGYIATLKTAKRSNHLVLVEQLSKISGVSFVEEL